MSVVVDASVAFKWFAAEEQDAGTAAALLRQEKAESVRRHRKAMRKRLEREGY